MNVRLPIEVPRTEDGQVDKATLSKQKEYLYFAQIKEHKTISPGFMYVFSSLTVARRVSLLTTSWHLDTPKSGGYDSVHRSTTI